MRTFVLLVAITALVGCTELPDVDPPVDNGDVDYPDLVPLGSLARDQEAIDTQAIDTEQSVASRVAGLRARAARLRTFQFE